MFKKKILFFLVMVYTILSISSVTVFSNSIIYEENTNSTKQSIVRITRPANDEATFKRSYIISGNTYEKDVTVKMLIYNESTGKYELFKNTEGKSSWRIGQSGFFVKEVELPQFGPNRIRLAAYTSEDENRLVLGENLQISNFTVTLLDGGIRQTLKSSFFRLTDMLNQLFR